MTAQAGVDFCSYCTACPRHPCRDQAEAQRCGNYEPAPSYDEEAVLRRALSELLDAARDLLNTEERSRVPSKAWMASDNVYYHFEKWAIDDLQMAVRSAADLLGEAPNEGSR